MAVFDCTKINMKNGSKDITTLQRELKKMGYYTKTLDTVYGYYTKQGVKKFQKKYGLTQDGVFGSVTCKKLNEVVEGTGTTNASSNTSTVSTTSIFDCPKISLKRNSSGSEVTKLQTLLKQLNYYTREVDGDFGEFTEKAVQQFQSAYKLKVDGWFASETCKKLTEVAVSKGLVTSTTTTKSSSSATSTPVSSIPEYARRITCKLVVHPDVVVLPESVTDENTNQTTVTGGSTSAQTNFDCSKISLRRNSKDKENVIKLQTILKAKGYYTRAIDGDFGKYTEQAVIKLQKAQGNDPDGYFGPKTCAKLQGTSTVSNNTTTSTSSTKKASDYTITDIKTMPSITDDMDGLSHDITLQTPYSDDKMSHIRKFQKTHFELYKDVELVYEHDGYINEIKLSQTDEAYMIEIQIVGYTAFLETTVTFEKTAKRSVLIKDLCALGGLNAVVNTEGFDDSEFTIKVQKESTKSDSSGLTTVNGTDCTGSAMHTNSLSARSYDINACGGNTKIGNSNANYAQDTKGMSAKEAIMDIFHRFKYGRTGNGDGYNDNEKCPQQMWKKTGSIYGNCADISRLVKCMGEVHGLKVGIRHAPSHYYNLIELNGKVYLFDCCFQSHKGYVANNKKYGGEKNNDLVFLGGPWSE